MFSLSHQFYRYIKSPKYLDSKAIAFIDSRISRCETLVQQAAPEVRVIVLGSMADSIDAITKILQSSYCRQVYLVSSGLPGTLYLGKNELSRNTLIQYQSQLQRWFEHIDPEEKERPQLHLCGSNVAAGDVGAEFLSQLNLLTRAEISASKNVYSSRVFN